MLLLTLQNLANLFFEPFHRMFSLDDRRISFPYADSERVPVPELMFFGAGLPLIVIVLYSLCVPSAGGSSKGHKLHVALLGLVTSLLLTSFITDAIKNTVGRPRPDLPAARRSRRPRDTNSSTGASAPRPDHHTLHDGFRSFPSGHSSFSWAGLGYLSLFLAGQLGALRRGKGLARVIFVALPAVGAALITISRTEDYRHDVYDVSTGTLIGATCAWFCYRRYFRGLQGRKSAIPYEREEPEEEQGFTKLREVEMGRVAGLVNDEEDMGNEWERERERERV